MARDSYYWINPDAPQYKVSKKDSDMTQKRLGKVLFNLMEPEKKELSRQYNDSINGAGKGSVFDTHLQNKKKSIGRDILSKNIDERIKNAPRKLKEDFDKEINDFFSQKGPVVKKIVDQHKENIADAMKSAKNEKNVIKKLGKKIKYAGGIDWKNDGADLVADIWSQNKNKVKSAAGIGLAAGTILVGKKLIKNREKKIDNAIRGAVKNRVRDHYYKKHNKDSEEQEKKAMVIPEGQRTRTEKNIRKIADGILPVAAAIPATLALNALTTAGGEIIRQRKREKQRAEWEEKNKDRRNNNARGYYISNQRGGQKYKNTKPHIQGEERSRNPQDGRTI